MMYSMSEVNIWPLPRTQYDVRATSAAENLERGREKVFSEPNEAFEIEVAEVNSKGKTFIQERNSIGGLT